MNPRTKKFLLIGGVGAVVVFGVGWYLTSGANTPATSSQSAGAQNAVNPNAQDAPGGPFAAQGTMPDIGNLLSYNQVPGALSAPQATSVSTGQTGDNTFPIPFFGSQPFIPAGAQSITQLPGYQPPAPGSIPQSQPIIVSGYMNG